MTPFQDLRKFILLTHQFQAIRRKVLSEDGEREENDQEHSFQLALSAWYIINRDHLALDASLAVRYALVHDLVEVHAGDTYIFGSDEEIATKAAREHAALQRLEADFPEFASAWETIHAYERRADAESRFVYVLDKILPMINILLVRDGLKWRQERVSLQRLLDNKRDKVALSPELAPYYAEFVRLLTEHEHELFLPAEECQ